ncbi:MAG TPA: DUF222 domain-containing protein [Mycobacteriales bacterium]|nr:DUF222 domain-containing protein [Mycobacteriales bacterium]
MYEDGGGVAVGAVGTDRRLGCPSHDDLLDRIVACEREIAGAQARQLALIAEFARSRPPSVGERPLAGASEFAVDELAVELRLSRLAAGARLVLAVTLADRLPGTAAALAAGDLDLPRARVVAEGTSTLDPPAALAVEARVLPRAVTQTVGQLRASVARAVLAVDPAGGQVRHERAAAGRRVAVSALPDGMAELWALLPAPAASAVYTAIDLHARRTGHPADVPMDARRADALLELVTRHARPTHAAPTGAGPSSAAPSSAAPSSAASTSAVPTSAVPISAASTSVAPTGAVPTSAVPTTSPPTSAAPTTAVPTCVAPITTAPTSAVPTNVVPADVVAIGAAIGVALTDAVSADGPVAGGAAAGAVPMSAVPMSAGQDSAVPMSAGPGSTAPASAAPGSAAPGSAVPGGAVPGGAVVVGRSALAPLVQVTVAASTLLGLDDLPGELAGYGPIPAGLARQLAADPTGTWRRILTDPATGAILDVGHRSYRPPRPLARFVTARDGTCRFPGCRQPARRCDLDHVIAWPDGPTTAANLIALCRHHHRLKHCGRWAVSADRDGALTWTAPTGRSYDTRPPPVTDPVPGHRPPPTALPGHGRPLPVPPDGRPPPTPRLVTADRRVEGAGRVPPGAGDSLDLRTRA